MTVRGRRRKRKKMEMESCLIVSCLTIWLLAIATAGARQQAPSDFQRNPFAISDIGSRSSSSSFVNNDEPNLSSSKLSLAQRMPVEKRRHDTLGESDREIQNGYYASQVNCGATKCILNFKNQAQEAQDEIERTKTRTKQQEQQHEEEHQKLEEQNQVAKQDEMIISNEQQREREDKFGQIESVAASRKANLSLGSDDEVARLDDKRQSREARPAVTTMELHARVRRLADAKLSSLSSHAQQQQTSSGNQSSQLSAPIVHAIAGHHRRLVIPCGQPATIMTQEIDGQIQGKSGRRTATTSSFRTQTNSTPSSVGGRLSLLVFHKDSQLDTPIFVADARNSAGSLRDSRQVISLDMLKNRAHVEEIIVGRSQQQQQAALIIDDPISEDSGLYTCTLEFVADPTRVHQVRVQVITPPTNMAILKVDKQSQQASEPLAVAANLQQPLLLGPFDEGSSLNLGCIADFGEPERGQISWWRAIDISEQQQEQANGSKSSVSKLPLSSLNSTNQNQWDLDNYMTTTSNSYLQRESDDMITLNNNNNNEYSHYFIAFHKSAQQSSQKRVSLPYPTKLWTRIIPANNVIEEIYATNEQQLKSVLNLSPLRRSHLEQEFICLATNNKLSPPLNVTIKLNMNLKPTEVKIINKPNYNFQLEQKIAIECQIRGSKPAPKVRWLLDDQELQFVMANNYTNSSNNNNYSETIRDMSKSEAEPFSCASHLTIIPQLSFHQKTLACSAQNPEMPNELAMSDSLVLDVQYAPQLTLQFGASIKPESMRLGADVYMNCNVSANPAAQLSDLIWLHNGQVLSANASAGIIMSSQSLVLQKIRLEQRGQYQCASQNVIGRGVSNMLDIKPKFEPRCDYTRTKQRYEVSLNNPVQIDCFVLAEPGDDVQFEWKFNRSLQIITPTASNTDNIAGLQAVVPASGTTNNAASEYADFQLESLGPTKPVVNPAQTTSLETLKQYETNFTRSYIMFRAESMRNSAGELQCRASNSIGSQAEPCIIQIIPFELPEPVIGCFTDTVTTNSFSIHCQPSAPPAELAVGQQKVKYMLELYNDGEQQAADDPGNPDADQASQLQDEATPTEDQNQVTSAAASAGEIDDYNDTSDKQQQKQRTKKTHLKQQRDEDHSADEQTKGQAKNKVGAKKRVKHIINDSPSFHLNGLKPNTNYQVLVYAQNSKSRSSASSVPARTLPDAGGSQLLESKLSVIELTGGKQQASESNQAGSGLTKLSDKLISYLKVGDYITLSGHSKQLIEISLIVLLCAISVALISFLVTNVCHSSSTSINNNNDDESNNNSRKKSRVSVRVAQASTDSAAAASSDRLEIFDPRRAQLDPSIQLLPATNHSDCIVDGNRTLVLRNSRGLAGTGSDSSRETNTESTLVTSSNSSSAVTQQTNATSDSYSSTKPLMGAGISCGGGEGGTRNRAGSDLMRPRASLDLVDQGSLLRVTKQQRGNCGHLSGTASLARHANYNGSQFQQHQEFLGSQHISATYYTHHNQQQQCPATAAIASGKMLLLGANSLLSSGGDSHPGTPQCSLRSNGGSDCVSSCHEQTGELAIPVPNTKNESDYSGFGSNSVVVPSNQSSSSVYLIHANNDDNSLQHNHARHVLNQQELYEDNSPNPRTTYLNQYLIENRNSRPMSNIGAQCRLFSHDDLSSSHRHYIPQMGGPYGKQFPDCDSMTSVSTINNNMLPSSTSIPISLANYSGDHMMLSSNDSRRSYSRAQDISQMMQEVVCADKMISRNPNASQSNNNFTNNNNLAATDDSISLSVVTPTLESHKRIDLNGQPLHNINMDSIDIHDENDLRNNNSIVCWQSGPNDCYREDEANCVGVEDWSDNTRSINVISPLLSQAQTLNKLNEGLSPETTDNQYLKSSGSSQKHPDNSSGRKKGHVKFED